MKWMPSLCLLCVLALPTSTWLVLGSEGAAVKLPVPAIAGARAQRSEEPRAAALVAARRTCRVDMLDQFIAQQRRLLEAAPTPAALQLLAEGLLERVLLRNHQRGLVVGEPLYRKLPPAIVSDLDEGLQSLQRARQLGGTDADAGRIEAALLSNEITGMAAALHLHSRIVAALDQAAARDGDNPALHVVLGLRQLLAPRLLGHDPQRALAHFEYAAAMMPDDERPLVFAAMATHLLGMRQRAIAWLQQATARNPENLFAGVVLARLCRGEDDPFGRDVEDAAAAPK